MNKQTLRRADTAMVESANTTFTKIGNEEEAFSFNAEHGFSLFLANRVKTIHCVRHAEGTHNEINKQFGSDEPVTFSTDGSWKYIDARLTNRGIEQCITAKRDLTQDLHPQLVVVSPFTRTLQTAHIMFGGKGHNFIVHHLAKERSGKFTCDKMRSKSEIGADMRPIYEQTADRIDFDTYGYPTEEDETWGEEREDSDLVIARSVKLLQWIASRPETEIVLVSHSSFFKHMFRTFGEQTHEKDKAKLHRLAGNAEIRSISLALHRGFYPPGRWIGDTDKFVPDDPTFRVGKWAPTDDAIQSLHESLRKDDCRSDTANSRQL